MTKLERAEKAQKHFADIQERQSNMKRFIILVLSIIMVFCLSSCGKEEKKDPKYCSSLVETGYDNLYYDTRTNIVYYIVYYRMSAYYCEHGIPYSFNPTTGELVCISN